MKWWILSTVNMVFLCGSILAVLSYQNPKLGSLNLISLIQSIWPLQACMDRLLDEESKAKQDIHINHACIDKIELVQKEWSSNCNANFSACFVLNSWLVCITVFDYSSTVLII